MSSSSITPRLVSTLDELHTLLRDLEPGWAASMLDLSARARAVGSSAQAQEVLGDVLSLFGGMGSLSDLVLQDRAGVRAEQVSLDRLRSELWEAALAGR